MICSILFCHSDTTSSKVQSYMLDSMVSVIQYGENIPAELLDVLLVNITPAQKVHNVVNSVECIHLYIVGNANFGWKMADCYFELCVCSAC